jgi:hypothetical protein
MTSNLLASNAAPAEALVSRRAKPLSRHFATAARLLLGGFLLICAFNGLLGLLPPPPPNLPDAAVAFNAGMAKAGYMMPLIFGTQALTGTLLLCNRFVPLALALLAPFTVNAVAFHLFLVPAGLAIALVLVALQLFLAWTHRAAFRPMLAARPVTS